METSRRSWPLLLFFAIIMVSLRCHAEDGNGAFLPHTSSAKSPTASIEHQELEDQRNQSYKNVEVRNGNEKNGGGGGGGGWRWGNAGVGGGGGGGGGGGSSSSSGSMGGGGGWGWGGGGGGWWGWGCMRPKRNHNGPGHGHKKRSYSNIEDYRIGEFAECMGRGRCQGMRLDCPLHCGGPCFYDCKNMCKAHCRR